MKNQDDRPPFTPKMRAAVLALHDGRGTDGIGGPTQQRIVKFGLAVWGPWVRGDDGKLRQTMALTALGRKRAAAAARRRRK